MRRDFFEDLEESNWWNQIDSLFDSYEEEESPRVRKRGSSWTYNRLNELADLEEFGVSAWGNESDRVSIPIQDEVILDESLFDEVYEAVLGLPDEDALKQLFWEILEFEPAYASVSRRLAERTPASINIPEIFAEAGLLRVLTTSVHGQDGLFGHLQDIRFLATEVGKEYETALLVVVDKTLAGQTLLILCSRDSHPKIYPVFDHKTATDAARILAETASQLFGLGSMAAYACLEKAFSSRQRDIDFREWINQNHDLSHWWVWHQYTKSKTLPASQQIELFRQLALLWPLNDRENSVVPSHPKARRLYDILLIRNLRLAAWMARKYRFLIGRGLEFEDLYQEGLKGLMRGIRGFDPALGNQFSTYATWWVRQSITRAIADLERTIRIPVHMLERIYRLATAYRQIRLEEGCEPSITDLARRLSISQHSVRQALKAMIEMVYIDSISDDENGHNLWASLEDAVQTTQFETVSRKQLQNQVLRVLATLKPREERVIRLRYGIGTGAEKTLEEIGQMFSLTRERIRQIEAKGLRHLCHHSRKRHLLPFCEN